MPDDHKNEALTTAYGEVCKSYHAIEDFRAKLLGLLPFASGAGIFLLLNDALTDDTKRRFAAHYLEPIGIFGFVVTLGLFFYELRGIQRCNALIAVGRELEALLQVRGQFADRPVRVAGFISSTLAARLIYPAVLAAWVFLALTLTGGRAAAVAAVLVFIGFFLASFLLKLSVDSKPKAV